MTAREKIRQFILNTKQNKVRKNIFLSLASVVVFITTYMLILPAITQTAETFCGYEEHTHGSSCYTKQSVLVCDRQEEESHVHTEACYEEDSVIVCGMDEYEGHIHGEECYAAEEYLVCESEDEEHEHDESCYYSETYLICDTEESEGHIHTEDCYEVHKNKVCGMEENEGHVHTESCYQKKEELSCTKEEHSHGDSCYVDRTADVENAAVWRSMFSYIEKTGVWREDLLQVAESQLGYAESRANYIVDENGHEKGYTRYGDWYGNAYGEWCAMYVSFCMNYADIDREVFPIDCNCQHWIDTLSKEEYGYYYDRESVLKGESEIIPGDLIFFDWDEDGTADHIGIVSRLETEEDPDTKQEVLKKIITIEGNCSDAVREQWYEMSDTSVKGFAYIPENPELDQKEVNQIRELSVRGSDYTITVKYGPEAGLPKDAVLNVRELTGEEYELKCAETMEATGLTELTFARFFDITFIASGEEVEPSAKVDVQISYDEALELSEDEVGTVIHFADEGTEVYDVTPEQTEEGTTFSFEQSSFSVTGTATGLSDEPMLLAADDPSTWSAAPPVGNLTGMVVREPVVGEWYMLFGYNSSTPANSYVLPETWPNRGTDGGRNTPLPKLSQATDQLGGTVKYTGSDDMAWQYVGDGGFVNRYGYYMYMRTRQVQNDDGSVSYRTEYSVTQTPGNRQLPLKYSWQYKAFYTEKSTTYSYGKYNILMINDFRGNGYSDHGDPVDNLTNPHSLTPSVDGYNYLPHYLAQVTGLDVTDGGHNNHPATSVTGKVDYSKPVLYSIDATQQTMTGVPGVVYTIRNQNGAVVTTVTTGSSVNVSIPNLNPGTYTIEQTSVPAGYVVSPQKRTVVIDTEGQGHPGIFYLYKSGDFGADKTGQVIDYVNRIYQVDLKAKSGKYSYTVDPVNLLLVVDQSNSMLFPQQLTPVRNNGQNVTVTLYRSGSYNGVTNDTRLTNLVNNGSLKKNTTYYLVTDENGDTATSTVYAIFWDGSGWCYQDASYYSKAYRARVLGDTVNVTETRSGSTYIVDFASSAEGYVDNKHGGSVSQQLKDKFENDLGTSGNGSRTYQLYTGSEYNRLHELQQAIAALAGLVGSLNEQSTLTIETFAKDVYGCKSYTLTNEGIIQVVDAANQITTLGGTRQDFALRHIYGDYSTGSGDNTNTPKFGSPANRTSNHTYNHLTSGDDYVILITDGAPNVTGGGTNSINDVINIASTLKGRMSGNDKLITVGLGAGNVGGNMLPNSASPPSATYYKRVEEAGILTDYFMNLFMKELAKNRKDVTSSADIVDIVSDSFYITDRNGNALSAGTRINLNGDPDPNGPGLVCYGPITHEADDDDDLLSSVTTNEWYVLWNDQSLGTGHGSYTLYRRQRLDNQNYNYSGYYIIIDGNYYRITNIDCQGDYSNRTWTISLDGHADYVSHEGNIILDLYTASAAPVTRTVYTYTDDNGTRTELDVNKIYYINFNNGRSISGTGEYDTTRDKLVYRNGQWIYHWRDQNGQTNRTGSVGSRVTSEQVTETSEASPAWDGKVYLKAKEDFIGGNVIDSNKEATVTLNEDGVTAKESISLPTPTLNVRLLEMEGFESEETVFLGDSVEHVKEKIEALLEMTVVNKIKDSTGNQMNDKNTPSDVSQAEANGLYEDHFTIPYAIRTQLTDSEWNDLINGRTVKIEYTYDDASSHGAVGYFELKLTKEAAEGEEDTYGDHSTAVTGVDVEKYKLNVTYKAYGNGDTADNTVNRGSNVHNGLNGPGTTVGTGADIPHGKGTEAVDEIHHVHVIDGEIYLTKVLDQSLVTDHDQTFSFYLHTKDSTTALRRAVVTVKANESIGTIRIEDLPRNHYVVDEDPSDQYVVEQVEVIDPDTNCVYITAKPSLEFDIGTNESSPAEDKDVIIHIQGSPELRDSLYADGQRYVYSYPFNNTAAESSGSGGTDSSGGSSAGGTHTETITEEIQVTDYAWTTGTIITADVSGNRYVKSNQTKAQLDASHTDYGILTQSSSNKDSWTVEWHTWTSRTETTGGSGGTTTYEPVNATVYEQNPNFTPYTNGEYYYKTDSGSYVKITSITGSAYWITINGSYGKGNDSGEWSQSLGQNVLTYIFYRQVTTGGSQPTTTTTWSEATRTETADQNKIPTTTRTETITREIEVPNDPEPSGTPVETVDSDKISVGHGRIINKAAEYEAALSVRKMWVGTGTHSDDTVYLVLFDPQGSAVRGSDGNGMMIQLNEAVRWRGTFTFSVGEADLNPIEAGYYVREVKRMQTTEFTDSIQVKLAGSESIYFVEPAEENDVVTINGTAYNVHYSNAGNTVYAVTNNESYVLPESGGSGTEVFTIGGGILMLSAVVIYIIGRRRRRERRYV